MRSRSLTVLFTVVLGLVLLLPIPASAVWTSVEEDDFSQIQHACRDGIVLDLSSRRPAGQMDVWVADSVVQDPATQWFAWRKFDVPPATATAIPDMRFPFDTVQSLGRNYTIPWPAPRQPGTTIRIREGQSPRFSTATIENCSINDRFDPFTVGYVLADDPTRASYAPAAFWSYNSKRQRNTVIRTGIGAYTVEFPGLASTGGNAQVTALGPAPAVCKIGSARWYTSGTAERLSVRCFAPNGAPADSRFTASFTAGGGTANTYAFAWADQPARLGQYPPNATYQYNNSGGAIGITRLSAGRYNVTVPSLYGPQPQGSVKVTAVGDTAANCNVAGWGPVSSAQVVGVSCATHAGQPVDQQFSISYQNRMNVVGSNVMSEAYVWAHDLHNPDRYTPVANYQSSRTMNDLDPITITKLYDTVGTYDVELHDHRGGFPYGGLPYVSMDGGTVHVTAYGSDDRRCQTGHWNTRSEDRVVRVYCFTTTGQPADAMFTLQYVAQFQ